ncbi:putative actin-like protein 6B [Apostichopus japonicus]|uniref:Putative actin-like protein 6B n=1 Tax=Stichopus japonicus TaxID=307972 RepID=A0A2G8K566_STIJA|nr:putative actin-like protein 6B [Apostichopus japonicus]
MSGGVYGGDEVNALVFDVGSYSVRAGYAGEDSPKADFPTVVGVMENKEAEGMEVDGAPPSSIKDSSEKKYIHDTSSILYPREHMEIGHPLKDGMIEDWDMFESTLNHIYKRHVQSDSSLHPVSCQSLLVRLQGAIRKNVLQGLILKVGVQLTGTHRMCCLRGGNFLSAFLSGSLEQGAHNFVGVLFSFANSRASGLVMDSGATHTTAVPIHEGYCLQHAIIKSPLGGDFITKQAKNFLTNQKIEVLPPTFIASRETVKEGQLPIFKRKELLKGVTQSWQDYMINTQIQDFQSSVLQVSDVPYDEDTVEQMPSAPYEFPTGYNMEFSSERIQVAEGLFDPTVIKAPGLEPSTMLSMAHIATSSVHMCDVDIRSALLSNVIVTGGNSLLLGFTDRLQRDLSLKTPQNTKLKVIAPSGTAERRFSSWIGGSILASLGTFQQMWLSKQEYEEMGRGCVEKKCP